MNAHGGRKKNESVSRSGSEEQKSNQGTPTVKRPRGRPRIHPLKTVVAARESVSNRSLVIEPDREVEEEKRPYRVSSRIASIKDRLAMRL